MTRKPVVFITGASKGLGLAVAKILLIDFNANVAALSRTETHELLDLHKSHGDSLLILKGDVIDTNVVPNAVESTIKTYQHLDGLVLNAGAISPMGKIADNDVPLDEWKSLFELNFFSLVTALRAALPELRKSELGGKVVFVSSGSAVKGTSAMAPYNASKAAMNSLCRTLAEEEPDVTCVAVRPGAVDTEMQTQLRAMGATTMNQKDYDRFATMHADKALVKPEDPAHVIAALSVNVPDSMSGQFISWDADECREFRR
ncbi:hypothetical protein AcW2_006151 [Taiwanofungus camphoratus]|nr:hypothetical protein AcW2_006151 [Antrodia cinnamomea]